MKDSEKFQMNVEVVSKALQEQAQTREPEEEARKLYKKFTATRQEPVRLAVAPRGFFLPQAEPEEREAYGKYLKGRIRPAVEAVIEEDGVEKLEKLEKLGWLEEKNLDLCLKEFHTFRQESMPDTEVYLIYIKNILLFFFTNGESSYEELDAYFQSVSFPGETVSVDYQRQKYPDLKSLLTMLIKRIKRYDIMYFIEGTGKVPTFNYGQIVEKINHLVPLLSAGNSEERESSLRELKSILTSVSNKDFLLQLADNIIISLGTHLPSGILPEITDFLYNLHKEENMAQIPVLVLDYIQKVISVSSFSSWQYGPFITKLIDYIQEHYKNPDLTLKWISENYLYMNVSYVSRCFTKETGEKFSGFLMNLRVQKAKEILASSGGEKIQDVAELVGCGNTPYYFSKIFKK